MKKLRIKNKFRFYTFIFTLITVLFVTLFIFTGSNLSLGASSKQVEFEYYTIRKNDTIWDIATRFKSDKMDVRDYVDIILYENEINNNIIPGTKLRIPII